MTTLPSVASGLVPSSIRRRLARRRAGLPSTGRIFGIGLSRTATSSLTSALSLLGYRSIHCPEDERTREELMAHFAAGGDRMRLSILEGRDAATDSPIAAAFEALDVAYPGSKFILTTRERESWLRSYRSFWEVVGLYLRERPHEPNARYITAFHEQLYGVASFDAERFTRGYDEHVRRVREHFRDRPDDLLTVDLCAGGDWGPLCEFLGMPIPDLPFPREKWPYDERQVGRQGVLPGLLRGARDSAGRG